MCRRRWWGLRQHRLQRPEQGGKFVLADVRGGRDQLDAWTRRPAGQRGDDLLLGLGSGPFRDGIGSGTLIGGAGRDQFDLEDAFRAGIQLDLTDFRSGTDVARLELFANNNFLRVSSLDSNLDGKLTSADAAVTLVADDLVLDLARADMMEAGTSGCCDARAAARKIADALQGGGFLVSVGTEVPVALVAIEAATLRAVLTTLLEDSRQAGATLAAITIPYC